MAEKKSHVLRVPHADCRSLRFCRCEGASYKWGASPASVEG